MLLLLIIPSFVESCEKVVPGHGAQLAQALDTVADAALLFGVALGVFATMLTQRLFRSVLESRWYRFRKTLALRSSRK